MEIKSRKTRLFGTGVFLATAESFAPGGPLEEVIALTTSIVSTLEFIELG